MTGPLLPYHKEDRQQTAGLFVNPTARQMVMTKRLQTLSEREVLLDQKFEKVRTKLVG